MNDAKDLHSLASGELSARVLLPWFIECMLQARTLCCVQSPVLTALSLSLFLYPVYLYLSLGVEKISTL